MRNISRLATLLANVGWGIMWGIGLACFYSFIALVIFLVRGTRSFDANDVTFAGVIAAYFAGGVVGGVVVGMLRPLARWRWGAAIIGFFAAIPVYAGIGVSIKGLSDIMGLIFVAMIGALLVGPLAGVLLWNHHQRTAPERDRWRGIYE